MQQQTHSPYEPKLPAAVAALPRGHRRALTALAGVVLGWAAFNLFYSLGDHPLYSPSEARYARVSQVMLESGNYLVPYFEDHVRLAKPPLVHWLHCAAMAVFGPTSAFAVRLPGVLATLATAAAAWWFMRRYRDGITAVMAATLVLVLPLEIVIGRAAVIDPLLNAFWCWAVVLGFAAYDRDWRGAGALRDGCAKPRAAYLLGFWVMVSLAVLAKGPVGLLPALGLVVWLMVRGRWRTLVHWHWMAGLIVSAAPMGAWALAVYWRYPDAAEVWYREMVSRVEGSGDHPQPWWYYLPVLLIGFFPATAMLPVPGWHVKWARWRERLRAGHPMAYLAIMAVVPIAVFSLMVGKLWTYVLPCGISLACIAAWWLRPWLDVTDDSRDIGKEHWARRLPDGTGTLAVVATLAVAGGAMVVGVPGLREMVGLSDEFDELLLKMILQSALVPGLLWAAWAMWRRADRRPWAIGVTGLAFAASGLFAMTIEDAAMQPRGIPAMLEAIDEQIDEPYVLTTVGDRDPSMSFYVQYHVARVGRVEGTAIHSPDELTAMAGPEGGRWVIVSYDDRWQQIADLAPRFAERFDVLLAWRRPLEAVTVLIERKADR